MEAPSEGCKARQWKTNSRLNQNNKFTDNYCE
uniref:Uncharacterized protein n=1 Tax=Arundo donax TaxID=35708 RepID=A0A0A9HJT0_ARUDO